MFALKTSVPFVCGPRGFKNYITWSNYIKYLLNTLDCFEKKAIEQGELCVVKHMYVPIAPYHTDQKVEN